MKPNSIAYLILTVAVTVHTILYFSYGLSLRGYWTDKIFVWIWLISTLLFIIFSFKTKIVKAYLGLLILLAALSAVPFGIPLMAFCGFVAARDRGFTYRITSNFRAQEIWKSPMAAGIVEVVEERGPFERIIGRLPLEYEAGGQYYRISEVRSMKVLKGPSAKVVIELSFPRGQVKEPIE